MKILAIYLPGFNREKINDKIWGDGFTEWNNVKSGKKLYRKHNQPLIPINHYYYDLQKKEDIEMQIDIAQKYKVDGFIIYHYWFGDNQQALEKPAELLKNKIKKKIEYCFCWANHSWLTTWHGKNTELIVEQKYGDEDEWKKHIEYLIPFFKDDRYIKINNRPVIYIYNMSEIYCIKDMINCWNEYLKENGLNKIYIVEMIHSKNKKLNYNNSDAVMEFEPLYTTFFSISKIRLFVRFLCKKLHLVDFQSYDYLCKKIIHRKRTYEDKLIYKSFFSGWDNSARKGQRSCMIVKNSNAKKFGKYLRKVIGNNRKNASNDFVIINAWNEWSEGAFLEPSENYKYSYLEEIKKIKDEQ